MNGYTARSVFDKLLLAPQQGTRTLAPLRLHPEQARLIEAFDAVEPETGLPRYDELGGFWMKKAGKSTTGGGLVIAELIGRSAEPDREVLIVASDLSQARDVIFASAARFAKRHPLLEKRIQVKRTELVYREQVTNDRTGGRHIEEHIARAIPARDAKSEHGRNPTLTVFDEFWTIDADTLEALAPSPARKVSRLLYFSYAGLKADRVDGNPLWDLWRRWEAKSSPRLFVSYIGGADGWKHVPWITQRFMDERREQFAHIPSKFLRLFQNEWASGDVGTFLTAQEIIDAKAAYQDSAPAPSDVVIGVDLGISFDLTGIVVSSVEGGTGRLRVHHAEGIRGTKRSPVKLMEVQDKILALARQYHTRRVVMDRWQAQLMAEQLQQRGLSVSLVSCDSAWLDRMATHLKTWFASRSIAIPNALMFVEQLETLEAQELRRQDRVRFTASGAAHDDIVTALCLSAQHFVGRDKRPEDSLIGKAVHPEGACVLHMNGLDWSACFIMGGHRWPYDPLCFKACNMLADLRRRHAAHQEKTGEQVNILHFYRQHPMRPNNYMQGARWMETDRMLGNLL